MTYSDRKDFLKRFDNLIDNDAADPNKWCIAISKQSKFEVQMQGKTNPLYNSGLDIYRGYYILFTEDDRLCNKEHPTYVGIVDLIKTKMAINLLLEVLKNQRMYAPFRAEITQNAIISLVSASGEFDIGDNLQLYKELNSYNNTQPKSDLISFFD